MGKKKSKLRSATAQSTVPVLQISEEAILDAIGADDVKRLKVWADDVKRLKVWAWRGALITSETPLHVAILEGRLNFVKCLVQDFGVGIYQVLQDEWYSTNALCVAAEYGNIDMMQCLVKELGTDVNRVDNDGFFPLYMAVSEGNLDAARYLV
jgi:ankyrin repeat protein